MGVIIRKNVFETNSSSTHSITIEKVDQFDNSLLYNDVLYPEHLHSTCDNSYDSSWTLVARTKLEKLALIAHWVKHLWFEDSFYLNVVFSKFEEIFGIKVNWDFSPEFYSSDDYSGVDYVSEKTFEDDLNKLKLIVEDDSVQIKQFLHEH